MTVGLAQSPTGGWNGGTSECGRADINNPRLANSGLVGTLMGQVKRLLKFRGQKVGENRLC